MADKREDLDVSDKVVLEAAKIEASKVSAEGSNKLQDAFANLIGGKKVSPVATIQDLITAGANLDLKAQIKRMQPYLKARMHAKYLVDLGIEDKEDCFESLLVDVALAVGVSMPDSEGKNRADKILDALKFLQLAEFEAAKGRSGIDKAFGANKK